MRKERKRTMEYIIGSRGSRLALVQTKYVQKRLQKEYPTHRFSICVIETRGDRIKDRPLHEIGGKGLFVREIEEQILAGKIHIGVHSMKDMPAFPPSGLVFTRPWKREDPRDALILRNAGTLSDLKEGAVIGTGSKRRKLQLERLRPDVKVVGIRGNVDTRLRKMEEEKLDGLILAAAGLHRLGFKDKISYYFEEQEMVPAPAQGVLALEIREDQEELRRMLDALSSDQTTQEVLCERMFLQKTGGDCHMPVGARCRKVQDGYEFYGIFGDDEGKRLVTVKREGKNPSSLAMEAVRQVKKEMTGTVFLVGAGPGDPGLITVKGKQILREADCILYDRLVLRELLEEAKPECEKIYVGKQNHHHRMKQEEINELLVRKAGQYQSVVRLKGGDPYVFGRGGEEGIYLASRGISFSVIPGISSCIAVPAGAGIPVTHRGISKGFHVVTAHDQRDRLSDLDFAALAKTRETLIFLMGLSSLELIQRKLQEAGMSPKTPAAVISNGLRPNQKVCQGTLETIAEKVFREPLISPAVIVVGDVVSLRDVLEEKRQPGYYLVAKTGEETSTVTKLLQKEGMAAKEIRLGEISFQKNPFARQELDGVHCLIFTSRYGVVGFMNQMREQNLDIRRLFGVQIAAVGQKTAEVLREYGICADIVPQTAGEIPLAECLKAKISRQDTIWHIKGTMGGEVLKQRLEGICDYQERIVYENRETAEEIPNLYGCRGIVFSSASAVRRFFHRINSQKAGYWDQKPPVFSIGPSTTKELRRMGIRDIRQAEHASYESMVQKIKESWLYY